MCSRGTPRTPWSSCTRCRCAARMTGCIPPIERMAGCIPPIALLAPCAAPQDATAGELRPEHFTPVAFGQCFEALLALLGCACADIHSRICGSLGLWFSECTRAQVWALPGPAVCVLRRDDGPRHDGRTCGACVCCGGGEVNRWGTQSAPATGMFDTDRLVAEALPVLRELQARGGGIGCARALALCWAVGVRVWGGGRGMRAHVPCS